MASIQKRTRKDGTTSYRVEIRMKGHPAQRATFKRVTDAKKWAQDTESAIREGRYFKTRESQRHTLSDLIDLFIVDKLPGRKDGRKTEAQLEWWRGELGDYTLADITAGRITECRKKLANGVTLHGTKRSTATVNRYLAALSTCLTYAVKDLGWLEDSPARKVRKGSEARGRVRFLSDHERTCLLAACKESTNPYLYPVVVLALSTGMRQAEIMGLRWSDVDLSQGRITLTETKNGEIRIVPLVGYALVLLKDHAKVRSIDTHMLFPGKRKRDRPQDLRNPWLEALKAAQIEDFRFHDLRHSAASYLAMNGASLADISHVLGHRTLEMTKRYSHLSEVHTAGILASMNERIFAHD